MKPHRLKVAPGPGSTRHNIHYMSRGHDITWVDGILRCLNCGQQTGSTTAATDCKKPWRHCQYCGQRLPKTARKDQRFCNQQCRTRAARRRSASV